MRRNEKTVKVINQHGPSGFVFFMAYIGAVVYFVQNSSGFFGFVWAFFKAIVWPALLVHHGLQALHT